jgi:group I intron endonuclease
MKISAIYIIKSIIKPERSYIGSAVRIDLRWNLHLSRLRRNIHDNKKLQSHFNKYGESDLQFSILLGCEKEDLIKIEQYFIDSYNPWFNHCKIAGNKLGVKTSDETKEKMSKSQKIRHELNPFSIETKNKMRLSVSNRPKISDKTRINIGNAKKISIIQYDKFGNIIKEWDSAIKVEKEIGIDSGNIARVLTGYRKTAGGFIWKYKFNLIRHAC